MKKYSMACTCGEVMTVDAGNREEAVEKLAGMMNEESVAKHFSEKHQGQMVPNQDQVRQGLEVTVVEATA